MREVKDDILKDAIRTSIDYKMQIASLKRVIGVLTLIIGILLWLLYITR